MRPRSTLDAIIIADSGVDSLSGTNPLKLHLDGRVGDIQVIANYLANSGRIIPPIAGDDQASWSSSPKLNGIYLYSYLTRKNFNVELIHNFTAEKNLFASLLAQNPMAVIVSTPFIFFKKTLRNLIADIRSLAPDIYIIAGGSFINYSYLLLERSLKGVYEANLAADDFLFLRSDNEPDIDLYIISPRGEDILCRALEKIHNGQSPEGLENTAHLSGKSYVFGQRSDSTALPPIPEVDWRLLPGSVFSAGVVPVQGSNGCPFDCAFCNFTKDRRFTFVKPVDRLADELNTVKQLGARYVWFVDDNFRLGRDDLDSVCRRFIEENIGIKWMCFIRASTLQKTNLDLLRQAGCMEVQIGLESGDPVILKNMNKKADPAMYREVIADVLNHGINVSCYFITGFPGETEISAAATREFIRQIENPEAEGNLSWSIYPFLLSPLSPVYEPDMRKKFGLTGYLNNWKHETMDYTRAKQLTLKAFVELENSGQIYRGDNLDMLAKLPSRKRKEFFIARHLFAKKALKKELDAKDIIDSFGRILGLAQRREADS